MSRDRWTQLALVAILFVAAFLRLRNLDASEFKYDEARVSNLAAQWVDTGIPPVRGMGSSAGIDNPPLAIYLLGPAVLLSRDPIVATGFVALLNVAGVWACFRLGRRYWSTAVGLIAALLLAVSPWAVFYSRKVWAQNMLLPFVILFVGLLLAWVVERRRWALCGAVVALSALTQIHLATIAFIPLFLVVLLVVLVLDIRQRRPIDWVIPLAVGVAVAAITYAPYLVFDALTGWRNVRALLETLGAPADIHWEAMRFALLNVGGREIHALAGAQRFQEFLDSIVGLYYWPDRLQEMLVVAATAYLTVRLVRERGEREALLRDSVLLLWLAAPVLFFLRSSSPVYPHYLIPLYPAPYLVMAIGTVDLLDAVADRPVLRRIVYAVAGLLVVALIAWQSYLSLSIHAFVEVHHTPGGMGTPIRILQQAAHAVRQRAQESGSPTVVVLCPGDDPVLDECPAVFAFQLGRDLDVRFADHDMALLVPAAATDTPVLLAPGESIAADVLDRYAEHLPSDAVWLREAVGAYHLYRLPAGQAPVPPNRPAGTPTHLSNGAALLGYSLSTPPSPGQNTQLSLYWRVDARPPDPPPQGYSFANHLLAADGQRHGQRDGPGYPVRWWRDGDHIVSWFEIPVSQDAPGPPYRLRTGMYTYIPPEEFIPVHVLDDAGQPAAEFVEWMVE